MGAGSGPGATAGGQESPEWTWPCSRCKTTLDATMDVCPNCRAAVRGKNGLAIASLVFGILGLGVRAFGVFSVLALIFGLRAMQQINASRGVQRGRGMATAGIILSVIHLGTLAIALLVFLFNPSSP